LFGLVFFSPPFLKRYLLSWFCGARIGRHVHIGWFSAVMGRRIAIGDHSEIRALTLINCDGDVIVGRYSIVSSFVLVYGSAGLAIGDHSYVGPQSLINTDEDVRIGNRSALGARCMVFTHGSFFPYTEGYWVKFGGVTIGDNVWCAAGVFIHPGVEIGDDVFVNSRSVLAQDVPSGAVMEGFPARRVTDLAKIRRAMTPRRVDGAIRQILKHCAEVALQRGLRIGVQQDSPDQISFSFRGQPYIVRCITSDGPEPSAAELADRRLVCLLNRPGWTPPPSLQAPLIIDLTTNRARAWRDPIHHELCVFLKRYYGIQVEFDTA
jgi:acetyltransferase-like isoleucine patch superfamily enzyme